MKWLNVVVVLLLLACGAAERSKPIVLPSTPDRKPGPLLDLYPECMGASEIGPVLNIDCITHCLPPRIMKRACTDLGEVFYVPVTDVVVVPYGRIMRENGCWQILKLDTQAIWYTDIDFSWASFAPEGEPCDIKYTQDWGWFGRNYGKFNFHTGTSAVLTEPGI